MIERRNIAVCIVLTLVTCGIYGIYWIVCLTNDVNTVSVEFTAFTGHISRERSLTLQRITVESRQATAVFCI